MSKERRQFIVPLGGGNLKHWVEKRYLDKLSCPQVHIYDNDVKGYQDMIDQVNQRGNGSWGTLTKKYEIENYLHPAAIKAVYNVEVDTDKENVPALVAKAYYEANKDKRDGQWRDSRAKTYLSKVFTDAMTCDMLEERDPDGEVKGWFDKIATILNSPK